MGQRWQARRQHTTKGKTMTDTRQDAYADLASLLDRAESNDPDWALTNEAPLDLDVRERYVYVLFTTGGPHTEILVEYDDAEAAEYWFENEPRVAVLTHMDWGTRADVSMSAHDAGKIMQAIMRDPSELDTDDDDDDE